MISDGVNGRLVDFFDVAAWSETLIDTLAHPEKYEHLQAAARRTIVETYDLRKHCLPRLVEFVEGELECTPGPHPLRATRTAQGLPPQAEEDRKSGVFLRFRGQVAAHCGTQLCRRWGALRRALKALRS